MDLQGITRSVASLEKSRQFYEGILGFEPDASYAPTHWQSYKCQGGAFFAIGEAPGSTNEVSFVVTDIETLWRQIKHKVDIVHPLEGTPWGTYRFVIRDPDGHSLAFGQKRAD